MRHPRPCSLPARACGSAPSRREITRVATSPGARAQGADSRRRCSRRADAASPATCASSSPGCSRRSRTSDGPGRRARRRAARAHSTAAPLRTANRLVGNPEGAAVVEVTMGGFRAVAAARPVVRGHRCVGADPPRGSRGRSVRGARRGRAGAELHLDWFAHGARAYLAVRGGLDGAAGAGVPRDRRARRTRSGAALRAGRRASGVRARRRTTRSRSPTSRRGARRTTTSSRSSSPPARGRDWFAASAHAGAVRGGLDRDERRRPGRDAPGRPGARARARRRAAERGHGARRAAGAAERAARRSCSPTDR